jgi:murein DD-endopeptidase MepM/ murein hydrolase activator NlpD
MANKEKGGFWGRWRSKHRFVILNGETFKEKYSFNLSRLNLFVLLGFILVILIGGTTILIAFSPMREYIPGYTSTSIRRQVVELNNLSDSLTLELEYQKQYLQNIENIVNGKPFEEKTFLELQNESVKIKAKFDKVVEDSVLRVQLETEEKFNLFEKSASKNNLEASFFYSPIKGVVTQGFDPAENHFGMDIVAKENAIIKATLAGTVVFSTWTSETGNVIGVLHQNNLFSIYKHNSVLLKKEGETVSAGEAIAIIGNSGKWSSGPHLHFELWQNGIAINPEQYILF